MYKRNAQPSDQHKTHPQDSKTLWRPTGKKPPYYISIMRLKVFFGPWPSAHCPTATNTPTMLKIAFVLGCLLSFALANPVSTCCLSFKKKRHLNTIAITARTQSSLHWVTLTVFISRRWTWAIKDLRVPSQDPTLALTPMRWELFQFYLTFLTKNLPVLRFIVPPLPPHPYLSSRPPLQQPPPLLPLQDSVKRNSSR